MLLLYFILAVTSENTLLVLKGFALIAPDKVYFSIVTFSTLGFGDIAPNSALTKRLAGSEASIGNLHLAAIVGTIFKATEPRESLFCAQALGHCIPNPLTAGRMFGAKLPKCKKQRR